MNHSEHYPTWIENPKTDQRALVKTPYEHHRQLLAWRMPGLDPEPAAPVVEPKPGTVIDPKYPTWIEHPKTGQRVLVANREAEKQQLEAWIAKKPVQAKQPPPPPPPAKPAGSATATIGAAGKAGTAKGKQPPAKLQPPTVEELIAKNYQPSVAQRMADEEIRKFNAGEPPYNQE